MKKKYNFIDLYYNDISEENINFTQPYQLSIGITPKCNSRCNYCVNWKDNKSIVPKAEQIVDIAKGGKELGIKQVLISGGEPLVHPDWKTIVQEIRKMDLDVLLITNGILLNEDSFKFLNEIGCKKIGISIDTLNEQKYLETRGIPIFRVLNNVYSIIENVHKEQRKNVSICCTIHKKNIDELENLLEFCLNSKLSIQFQPIQLDSIAPENAKNEYWPTDEQQAKLKLFFERLGSLKMNGDSIGNSIEYINNIITYFANSAFVPQKCYATWAQITIDQTLGLRPCWAMPKVGNVKSGQDLIELWNSEKIKKIRNNAKNNVCPGCYYCCHLSKKYNLL